MTEVAACPTAQCFPDSYIDEDPQKSLEELTKALEEKSDDAECYCQRAYAYILLRNYNDAVLDAKRSLELQPNNANAFLRKGEAEFHLQNYTSAEDSFRQGQKLDSSDTTFSIWIKKCEEKLNVSSNVEEVTKRVKQNTAVSGGTGFTTGEEYSDSSTSPRTLFRFLFQPICGSEEGRRLLSYFGHQETELQDGIFAFCHSSNVPWGVSGSSKYSGEYLPTPIHPCSHGYLQFAFGLDNYQFTALPFGLASAPPVCTRFVGALVAFIHTLGISMTPYLDDLLFKAASEELLVQHIQDCAGLLVHHGWVLNILKLSPVPSQELVFLGKRIDTCQGKVFLSEEKIRPVMHNEAKMSDVLSDAGAQCLGMKLECLDSPSYVCALAEGRIQGGMCVEEGKLAEVIKMVERSKRMTAFPNSAQQHQENRRVAQGVIKSRHCFIMLFVLRHDWYQTESQIIITVMIKNVQKDDVHIEFSERELNADVNLPSGENYNLKLSLFHSIVPEQSTFKVLSSKIEIKMKKTEAIRWDSLEGQAQSKLKHFATEATHKYPSSSHYTKNWDKLVVEIKEEEKNEKMEGDAALNQLFQQIYSDGSDEVKRAMNKSFMESGGTVLSTNWTDVGKRKVEVNPPDDMEWKKF
ncbi:protein SGT1 homolog [Rhinophrynus dorsalis]